MMLRIQKQKGFIEINDGCDDTREIAVGHNRHGAVIVLTREEAEQVRMALARHPEEES